MSKHTPGPWTAREPNGPGIGWRVGPAWLGEKPWSDETSANAHLIAAAPDLLEMLEKCVAALEAVDRTYASAASSEVRRKVLDEACTVVTKAKGEG
jgi:hypothetical protein